MAIIGGEATIFAIGSPLTAAIETKIDANIGYSLFWLPDDLFIVTGIEGSSTINRL